MKINKNVVIVFAIGSAVAIVTFMVKSGVFWQHTLVLLGLSC